MLTALLLAAATGCTIQRDAAGEIIRDASAVSHFRKVNSCPATGLTTGACPGWVVDHIWPLCAGGCDKPENMQWQQTTESRLKDTLEKFLCGFTVLPVTIQKARCELKVDPTICVIP